MLFVCEEQTDLKTVDSCILYMALTLPLNGKLDKIRKKTSNLIKNKEKKEEKKNAQVVFIFKAKWHKRTQYFLSCAGKTRAFWNRNYKKCVQPHAQLSKIKKKLSELFDDTLCMSSNATVPMLLQLFVFNHILLRLHTHTTLLPCKRKKNSLFLYGIVKRFIDA